MASDILDRVAMVITDTGTGDVTANVLISNRFNTPQEAGAVNAGSYWWMLEEGTDYQIFEGVWTLSTTKVARTTTWQSKIAGVHGAANMTLAGNATLRSITPAEAFNFLLRADKSQSLSSTRKDTARKNAGVLSGGGLANLYSYNTGANTASLTADAVALYDSSGNMYGATSVSLSLNIATAGANGLDTGSLSTTGFYFFIIYNPTTDTVAGLYSLSATAPTMPSGYTYKRRVGWIFYSSGITGYIQRNRHFSYTSQRTVASGTSNPAAYFSLNGFAPPTASIIRGVMISNNNSVMVSDNIGQTIMSLNTVTSAQCFWFYEFVVQNGTFQVNYFSSSSGGYCAIQGWEDNI
jgi:hypothetical protein